MIDITRVKYLRLTKLSVLNLNMRLLLRRYAVFMICEPKDIPTDPS